MIREQGKVELSIERYEELTELERNWQEKQLEVTALEGKLISDGAVLYKQHNYFLNSICVGPGEYTYFGRDEAIKKAVNDANHAIRIAAKYKRASFFDRILYLFFGKLLEELTNTKETD